MTDSIFRITALSADQGYQATRQLRAIKLQTLPQVLKSVVPMSHDVTVFAAHTSAMRKLICLEESLSPKPLQKMKTMHRRRL